MPTTQPNILFIILDTMRRDRLSVYGYERQTSPHFDTFAAQSTLFERAIATAQWTIPSHASMFTGVYPGVHGVTQSDGRIPDELPVLAELLRGGGYHTVAFSNNPLVGVLDNGMRRGFDHFFNYAGAAPNRPFDANQNRLRRAFMRRFRPFALRTSNVFAQSHALFRLSLNPLFVPIWTRLINYKGHTQRSIDDLMDYWGQHHDGRADRPIFAFLNLMGTHLPYRPPQVYLDKVAPDLRGDKRAYRFMGRFNADAARWASPNIPPLSGDERQIIDDFYDAEILHQDEHLGRLFRYLEQSGALENTLVIVAADHGEGHGDHDFFGHGFVVNQELVHVPLIIRYPALFPAGKRIPTNVSTRRIFHTLMDVTGLRPAYSDDHPNADLSGLSLVKSLNGRPDTEGNVAFSEAFPPAAFLNVLEHRSPSLIEQLRLTLVRRAAYDGGHKLTVVGSQVDALYQLQDDPLETRNVAGDNPVLVNMLHHKLDQFVHTSQQHYQAGSRGEVSDEVLDNLRALGYIE